jgi:hypothetical protein
MGASTSCNPQGLPRPGMGLLYFMHTTRLALKKIFSPSKYNGK